MYDFILSFKKYLFANIIIVLSGFICILINLLVHNNEPPLMHNEVISLETLYIIHIAILCKILLYLYLFLIFEILLKKYFPRLQIKININIPQIITKIYNIIFFVGFTFASVVSVFALLFLLIYFGCFLCDKIQYLFSQWI